MKIVRLNSETVVEVIPNYALPVEKWYGAEFASQCVEAPDEVEQHWSYNSEDGTWNEPTIQDPVVDVETQIAELKAQLSSTDYKIIKCSEAQLVGEELPYDIVALHEERQALRDKINELEGSVQ